MLKVNSPLQSDDSLCTRTKISALSTVLSLTKEKSLSQTQRKK